jgi:hypothetical protein
VPTLSRKKDGDHYYIRVYVHARGGVATYSVTKQGVEWLQAQGVPTHRNGAQLSPQLFKALLDRHWASTGGSGLNVATKDRLLALLDSATSSPADCTTADLSDTHVLEGPSLSFEIEEPWRLVLRFASLPQTLLPSGGVDVWTQLLEDSRITTPAAPYPGNGLQVWPGSLGLSLPVVPQEISYEVTLQGKWPSAVLVAWSATIPGLASKGSFFSEPTGDGRRLAFGTPLTLGSAYVLIRQAGTSQLLPQGLTAQPLGIVDNWEAFRLAMPTHPSPTLKRWIGELGHSVQPSPWSLRLVSPLPHRFTVHGQPVVARGRPLLLTCEPPGDSLAWPAASFFEIVTQGGRRAIAELPPLLGHDGQYVLLPPLPTGSYLLRATDDWSTSLAFHVEVWQPPLWPASGLTLTPIRVQVGAVTARAFEAPVVLTAPPAAVLSDVAIIVDTRASRVRLSLYPREGFPRQRVVASSDAPAVIRDWLAKPAPSGEATVLVDAGPGLGRAALLVTWPVSKSVYSPRARWHGWRETIVPTLVRRGRIPKVLGRLWQQSMKGQEGEG